MDFLCKTRGNRKHLAVAVPGGTGDVEAQDFVGARELLFLLAAINGIEKVGSSRRGRPARACAI